MSRDEGGEESRKIARHLDDIFAQNGEKPPDPGMEATMALRGLKAVMLEIEWEITDAAMARLVDQAERLKKQLSANRILQLFLQLFISIGKYIRGKKAIAHPDSIHLLNSVYTALEQVYLSTAMTEKGKKDLLMTEVDKFKKLKAKIALGRAEGETEEHPAAAAPPPIDLNQMDNRQALSFMLEEIKKVIREEFKALKAEMRM